jgi:hypothetical protein
VGKLLMSHHWHAFGGKRVTGSREQGSGASGQAGKLLM